MRGLGDYPGTTPALPGHDPGVAPAMTRAMTGR